MKCFPEVMVLGFKRRRRVQRTAGLRFVCWCYRPHYLQDHAPLVGWLPQSFVNTPRTRSSILIGFASLTTKTHRKERRTVETSCMKKIKSCMTTEDSAETCQSMITVSRAPRVDMAGWQGSCGYRWWLQSLLRHRAEYVISTHCSWIADLLSSFLTLQTRRFVVPPLETRKLQGLPCDRRSAR